MKKDITFFFLFLSAKNFFVCSLIRKGCHFLFVCLIVCFCWVKCVMGVRGCVGVCVCVCTKGRGRVFVWGDVGCFCCLQNPGYDKFKFMISYMLHCISMPSWLCFLIFYSYWGSPLLGVLWGLFSGCSCLAWLTFCFSCLSHSAKILLRS